MQTYEVCGRKTAAENPEEKPVMIERGGGDNKLIGGWGVKINFGFVVVRNY